MLIKFNNSLLFKEETSYLMYYLASGCYYGVKLVIYNECIISYSNIYIDSLNQKLLHLVPISLDFAPNFNNPNQGFYRLSIANIELDLFKFKSFFLLLCHNMTINYDN